MNEENTNTHIKVDATEYQTQLTRKYLTRKKYVPADPSLLSTAIPGVVRDVFVKEGTRVKKGDKVLLLEAMKMMNNIQAPVDGTVDKIFVIVGQQVAKNESLIKFKMS